MSLSVAAASLVLSGAAMAQTANGGALSAKVQAVYGEWRQLAQKEINCIDQSLRGQKTTLWALIQRGIHPSDSTVARLRAGCRAQARAPDREAVATQAVKPAAPISGTPATVTATTVESVPPRPPADKAVSEQALADRAAALAQAAEERSAASKAATDKVAAEKAAADRAAADRAAAVKAAADKAAEKAAAEKIAIETAKVEAKTEAKVEPKPEAERAKAQTIKVAAESEQQRKDADNSVSETTLAYVAAESRRSFFLGLVSSPICFGLGGVVFLLVQRRRRTTDTPSEAASPQRVHGLDETVLH